MTENITTRQKRSQKLTIGELRGLERYVGDFDTRMEAAESIGIDRQTLSDVLSRRRARTDTIAKINAAIAAKSQTH